MTKLDEIKEYLLSELRANVRQEKNKSVNRDFIDGSRTIIRFLLEDFFMTRDEVGTIINETWSE